MWYEETVITLHHQKFKVQKVMKSHLKELAESYEVENFYDYIIETQANGNFSQVCELFFELNPEERNAFYDYAKVNAPYGPEAIETIWKFSKHLR